MSAMTLAVQFKLDYSCCSGHTDDDDDENKLIRDLRTDVCLAP